MTPHPSAPRHRRRTALAAGALAALSLSTAVALAAGPGDLDTSFGEDGRVVLRTSVYPNTVLALPGGKTVLTDLNSPTVIRLTADGTPDRGFAGDGTAVLPFDSNVLAAALPDGKLLVSAAPSLREIVVARLLEDGRLDPAFGPGGEDGDGVRTYTGLGIAGAAELLVEPDGTIVLAGPQRDGYGFGGARLTADGEVEQAAFEHVPAFGGQPQAAALAPDGGLVVAGSRNREGSSDNEVYVTRFTAEGKLDATLDGTGTILHGEAGRSLTPRDVLVQPDGAIVLAVGSTAPDRSLLMRFRSDGTPDPGFGDDGTVVPEFVGDDMPAAVTRQPDGKLLLAGTNTTAHEYLVGRFTPAGEPDRGFGIDGTAAGGLRRPGRRPGRRPRRGRAARRRRHRRHGQPDGPAPSGAADAHRRPGSGDATRRRPEARPRPRRRSRPGRRPARADVRRPPRDDRRHRGRRDAARHVRRRRDRRRWRPRHDPRARRSRHRLRRRWS